MCVHQKKSMMLEAICLILGTTMCQHHQSVFQVYSALLIICRLDILSHLTNEKIET